ncbi:hypothetical protein [Candidatus Rariloculus sp.]|uniref:hypothetical protein n=1 Tax=Candidatus Rariloculus sp. TaxID=3101265 RepID=UPI003D0D9991
MQKLYRHIGIGIGTALVASLSLAQGPADNASFFVTSENPGSGGDLGGLAGADAHCQALAEAAGMGGKTWQAYLSTSTVDARDRTGDGPWYNVAGVMIAADVEQLHGENNITNETATDENGDTPAYLFLVDGEVQRPEDALVHDVLTGSNEDGTAHELTCNDWTDGSADAQAMLGHADRLGRNPGINPWNAAHPSQGCAMENLIPTGGAGMFYCFAVD